VPFAKINLNQDFNLYDLRSLDAGLVEFWQRFGKRKIGRNIGLLQLDARSAS
jgi:tetrahydromethanopterin S-methyltransferase subunit G